VRGFFARPARPQKRFPVAYRKGRETSLRFEDFAFIHDPATGLVCCRVPVGSATEDLTRSVRTFYAERVAHFGYTGFSWEIDDVFHQRSVYLVVADESGNLVMTSRGTHRLPGEALPFEIALRDGGPSYVLDPGLPVMDFNTYTYRPGTYETAMPLQIAGLGCYARLQGARRAFCLYDVKNDRIRRAYPSFGWEHAPDFPDPIYFPTYGRREEGGFKPAQWRVCHWTEETIERLDKEARRKFVVIDPSLK
jgi:hypothetical protein